MMLGKALILMVAAEGLSLLAFNFPVLSPPLLIVSAIIVFALSLKNQERGIYILFGELFFGSRGHLLEYDLGFVSISLRLVIFTAVFGAWALSVILSPRPGGRRIPEILRYAQDDKLVWIYLSLLAVIAFGIINGYLRGNSISNIFNDANGYLYLLIFPAVMSVIKTREQVNNLLQILAAAILVVAGKTFLLFLWFSFGFPGVAASYHWIISQDFGEITGQVGSASRIFMQSQFWALIGLFVFSVPMSLRGNPKQSQGIEIASLPLAKTMIWIVIISALLSIIMSLSRSFWLGAIAGGMFASVVVLWRFRSNLRAFLGLGLKIGAIAVLEIALLYGVVALGGGQFAESVSSRTGDPTREAAGGARLLLLPELAAAIKDTPILGAGFGKLVTYKSYLPDRVSAENPDGEITNYAFEWGYLDILLKIGIVGLVIYLLFIAQIFRQWFEMKNLNIKMQNLGILSGLVALLALNMTTPYLNHPLGIGYLFLSFLVFSVWN